VKKMAETLELQFMTEGGNNARLSVDNPKEPIEEAVIKQAMEEIIAAEVFYPTGGKFVSAKGARVIERNLTDYELV
jgi:hypothetical protein